MSIVNSTHREADESMKNKKPNYEKGLKAVSGISGILVLLFLLISCYTVMAQWKSGKLIVFVILAGIFCNVILLIFLAKKWREQFRGIMAEFRKMYSDLLQLPSPCMKEKSVLNELSDMIDYLEKGLMIPAGCLCVYRNFRISSVSFCSRLMRDRKSVV